MADPSTRPSRAILVILLGLLYPPRCALCRRDLVRAAEARLCRCCAAALSLDEEVCARCGDRLGRSPGGALCARCIADPPPFRLARACFVYSENGLEPPQRPKGAGRVRRDGRDAILGWKYRRDHALGAALARHLAETSPFRVADYDLVVPVPLHPSRLRSRGFNQAAILARELARGRSRFAPGALRRQVSTPTQTALSRRARAANVAGAFVVAPGAAVAGRAVLLVDDVLTSGATAAACSRCLLDAGARLVDVVALARASRIEPPDRAGTSLAVPRARGGLD